MPQNSKTNTVLLTYTYLWAGVTFLKFNKVELSQPSTDKGRRGSLRPLPPNIAQRHTISAEVIPVIAPTSLALSKNIPNVKIPRIGPLITPEIDIAISTNAPIDLARKAVDRQRNPFAMVSPLPIIVALSFGNCSPSFLHEGFM